MADFLLVIRAGATAYDLQGRISGSLDIPLSPEGVAEATQTAALVATEQPVALYASTAVSAFETATIIGRTIGLRPRGVATLENLNHGLWQGMLGAEIRRKQPRLYRQRQENPWSVSPPEGELLEDACRRIEAALEKLLKRHARGRVAIVLPDPLDRLVRWLVAGESLGDLWLRDPNGKPIVALPLAVQWRTGRLLTQGEHGTRASRHYGGLEKMQS
jgi:broad specificity phosphatase PhoE